MQPGIAEPANCMVGGGYNRRRQWQKSEETSLGSPPRRDSQPVVDTFEVVDLMGGDVVKQRWQVRGGLRKSYHMRI